MNLEVSNEVTKQGASCHWGRRRVRFCRIVIGCCLGGSREFISDEFEYGFFYGTFDEDLNIALFAGGTFEEFCASDPDGGPGTAPLRVFPRRDGTTDLKVNAKGQPIYLYETEFNDIPEWLGTACAGILINGDVPPEPFAVGEADLKVRITVVSEDRAEIFNSVNGEATGTDGTEYKVRGSADLIVDGGIPVGDPRDSVDFAEGDHALNLRRRCVRNTAQAVYCTFPGGGDRSRNGDVSTIERGDVS